MRTRDLPDISALGRRAYISGKSLVPMLQLSHVWLAMANWQVRWGLWPAGFSGGAMRGSRLWCGLVPHGPPGLGMFWDHTHDGLFGFPSVFPSLVGSRKFQLPLAFSDGVGHGAVSCVCALCWTGYIAYCATHDGSCTCPARM